MHSLAIGALTTCEIANDGAGACLNFVDVNGREQSVYVHIECLKQLTLSMPKSCGRRFAFNFTTQPCDWSTPLKIGGRTRKRWQASSDTYDSRPFCHFIWHQS